MEVVGAREQGSPRCDLVAQAFGIAHHLLRGTLVGPEVGRGGLSVELVDADLFGV